ncbi:ComE operon protein 3 [Rubrobacter xylanophilus DSM 9941]|uniref:ComEC/Rec2 family competence protein n=1 Tax=Rubrobacter xylanophilus TaxID=49319 RepID=UPI001C64408B|nr:ComEC/Rec2 family competence protein [Rubrobacter xylanophilus]QYJ16246.1 ComE operon protein 3 [Rubrobacter xylanophilus DSM 9941]
MGRFPRRASSLMALALVLLLAACSGVSGGVGPPPSGALSVSFIDVGQGDAVLVQAGGEDYLVDAGNPEEGPVVVDFLRERGVDDLEGMVSTSGDADHAGGLAEVLEAFPVEKVYLSGYPKDTLTYAGFLRAVRDEEGVEVERVRAGHRTEWGGVRVDVLNPPPGGFFSSSNDNSVALLLTYGRARVLLGGDAERQAKEYMANGPYTGPLTVLKVNHHGSETSTGPLFLSRFRPRVAVIQCGRDNPYGHPDPEVLERLRRAGARVFRTDLHGDVIVTIRRDLVEVAVEWPVRAGA